MGCCGSSRSNNQGQQSANYEERSLSPIEQLKIRLARGEITFEEYEKIKSEIAQDK